MNLSATRTTPARTTLARTALARALAVIGTGLLLAACGTAADPTAADDAEVAATDPTDEPAPDPEPDPATDTAAAPEPAPEPEPEPEPPYPPDWHERALDIAAASRPAVVAIGWVPPDLAMGRVETGFLVAEDLVVTSGEVGLAGEEHTLGVRTFDGQRRQASVVYRGPEYLGVSVLQLDAPVDGPTLRFGDETELVAGAPLLAIGHPASASAEGGWLVTAGPFVRIEDRALWADLVAPIGGGGFFEGGMSGAPVLDLAGAVVAVACCQQPWGPQLSIANAEPAEVLLRRHVVVDERSWHGGATATVTRAAIADLLPEDP